MDKPRALRTLGRRSTLLVLAAAAAVVAVGGATAGSKKATATGTATVRMTGDYITLDWQRRATTGVFPFSYPLYDRLVAWNKDGTDVVPYLATSWKVTPLNRPKQIVFTMRRDAKCSDGTPVTPSVVKASFERFITVPKISNQIARWYGPGPFKFLANNKKGTFTVTTQTPFATLLQGFAVAGGIICPAGLAATANDVNAMSDAAYGSGPYTLVSSAHNNQVVYQKNPNWKWGPPGSDISKMPDTLIYKIIGDNTTSANLLLTGGLDIAQISGPDVTRLRANKSLQYKPAQNYHFMPLVFNQNAGRVTTDLNVRKAIMTAISAADWAKAAFPVDGATVSPSVFNPKWKCYDKSVKSLVPTGGPAKARQLLQSAGWSLNSNGILTKNGQTLKITLLSSPDLVGGAGEYMAAQLKATGIDVNLQDLAPALYSPNYVSANFDAAISYTNWYAPYPDIGVYHGGAAIAKAGGGDQQWERATLIATQRTDCTWWSTVQRLTVQKAVMFPLAEPLEHGFANQNWNFPAPLRVIEPEYITKR